uniref:CUB domain-containing protein n=1 Tax=Macrostomum lignano TaxID=282301 RepID=A0A1I8F6N5_9PLAT
SPSSARSCGSPSWLPADGGENSAVAEQQPSSPKSLRVGGWCTFELGKYEPTNIHYQLNSKECELRWPGLPATASAFSRSCAQQRRQRQNNPRTVRISFLTIIFARRGCCCELRLLPMRWIIRAIDDGELSADSCGRRGLLLQAAAEAGGAQIERVWK